MQGLFGTHAKTVRRRKCASLEVDFEAEGVVGEVDISLWVVVYPFTFLNKELAANLLVETVIFRNFLRYIFVV